MPQLTLIAAVASADALAHLVRREAKVPDCHRLTKYLS